GEHDAAREQDADLLMRVRMLLDDGVRLHFDEGEHHLLGGARADVDAGEDRVPAHLVRRGEELAHQGPSLRKRRPNTAGISPATRCSRAELHCSPLLPLRSSVVSRGAEISLTPRAGGRQCHWLLLSATGVPPMAAPADPRPFLTKPEA